MDNITNLIQDSSIFDKRAVLYYLARILKQAKIQKIYRKDIFVDSVESAPSTYVVDLTQRVLEEIQQSAAKKATEFSESEFNYWMDIIAEIEDNIDELPSEEEKSNADKKLSQLNVNLKSVRGI